MSAALGLAEELLLVAYDDERGRNRSDWGLEPGLAGALLIELADAGRLAADGEHLVPSGAGRPPGGLPGAALAVLAAGRPRSAAHWVHRLPHALDPLRRRIAAGLVGRGILREEHGRALRVVPVTRFPAGEPAVEAALVARLRGVLLDGRVPDVRTAQLVGLLHGVQLVGVIVARDERRAARGRAREIAKSGAAAGDVPAAVLAAVAVAAEAVAAGADAG